MPRADNPFASPLAPLTGAPEDEAERTRKKYLKHEASIQSIGTLCFLGGIVLGLIAVGRIFVSLSFRNSPLAGVLVGLIFLGLTALSFWLGYGLRRLNRKVTIPTGILAGFGLILFPLGTLISAYALYLIFSQKGTVVFSPEYHEVIRLTPHIKYRTSIAAWTVLILFILFIVGVLVVPAIMNSR